MDKTVIHNGATNETVVFKCKAWLDATSGDGKLERNFYPLTDCSYKIELQTSDLRGAGTSANGVISLLGSLAEAGPFQLANDGKTFQRGSLDVMTLDSVPDIGVIQQVMLTTGMSHNMTLLACFSAVWHVAGKCEFETGAVCAVECDPHDGIHMMGSKHDDDDDGGHDRFS